MIEKMSEALPILEKIKDSCSTVKWLEELGLIPTTKFCKTHKKMMRLSGEGVFALFECNTKNKRHRVSRAENTWFERCRISPEQCIILSYCFVYKFSYEDSIREASIPGRTISSETVADRFSFCREICIIVLDDIYKNEGIIGGPGRSVEVDETKIGKRKYERGPIIDGNWVITMIERDSVEYRLEICPENARDKETLIAIIKKNVAPGTEIHTDCWKGYIDLKEHGYIHKSVNQSQNLVESETGVHTENIDSCWMPLKKMLCRRGSKKENLDTHLCEFLWRRRAEKLNKDIFQIFLEDVRATYDNNE